jgi:zinc protease
MKRTMTFVIGAASALALLACSGAPALTPLPPAPPAPSASTPPAASSVAWTPAPDAPFRQSPPEAAAAPAWSAPVPTERQLSNGMHVLVVRSTQLPIVAVHVVSRRGADQQRMVGLGSFVGRMLEQGTKSRSALQVSDDYEAIGAEHGAWVTWDSTNVWMKVLPAQLDRGIEIIADVVQNPAFADDEIERARSQALASWKQMLDSPQAIASRMVARAVFPGHPYGEILLGDEDAIKRIKRQDLVTFYETVMVPSETAVVVVGNVDPDAVTAKLDKAFGSWKRRTAPAVKVRKPTPLSRAIVLVDQPGAAQSVIAVAGIGAERTSKDHDAIEVANTVFGGMFSSRLNLNLREKHAYTYGARSWFEMRHGAGAFTARASVDTPNTGPALREMIGELQTFCTAPTRPEELNLAMGQLIRSMPGDFEGVAATASQVADLWVYGLPLDTYRTQPARYGAVTVDDIQRVAAERMHVGNAVIVVVGDKKVVLPQLQELRFGPIKIVDKQGKLIETVGGTGGYVGYACARPAEASAKPAAQPPTRLKLPPATKPAQAPSKPPTGPAPKAVPTR